MYKTGRFLHKNAGFLGENCIFSLLVSTERYVENFVVQLFLLKTLLKSHGSVEKLLKTLLKTI